MKIATGQSSFERRKGVESPIIPDVGGAYTYLSGCGRVFFALDGIVWARWAVQ